MSEFEILAIPISLILGLGVARILTGFVHAIRERRVAQPHWVPVAWAFSILVLNVVYFNVLYDMHVSGALWTWKRYGPVLGQTGLLFLSAGLILPGESGAGRADMLADFQEHGRLALLPLGLLLGSAPIANFLDDGSPWLGLNNVANLALTIIIIAVFKMSGGKGRDLLSGLFAILMVLSALFAWAQPGVTS